MDCAEDDCRACSNFGEASNETLQINDKEVHDTVDNSLNPLASVFNTKLRLNSIKKLFKKLRHNTCETNKLTDLNYFELFEKSFNVSADKNQNKFNNAESDYDYNRAACSLNPSATIFKPRPKSSINVLRI